MKKFSIILNEQELNVVFASLGKMPFESVFQTINNIQKQISEQKDNSNNDGKFIVD